MVSHKHSELDNGLQVVTVEQPHLHSADLSLYVRCGSRHESDAEWGLSHLLEHMLYRGSVRFPDTRTLARAFERCGGTVHAETWRDQTHLSLTLHPSQVSSALEVLADMVTRPVFEGLDIERSIVEDELSGELDEEGQDTDLTNVSRAAIWRNHPMGRRIAGSYESIASFRHDDVREHHQRHYVGRNALVAVAGPIDGNEIEEAVARTLGRMPHGEATAAGEPPPPLEAGAQLVTRHSDGSHLEVALSFEALPDGHDDFTAQVLLGHILDDGVGSRLQDAVCSKRGLVYELSTGFDCYSDCGLYDIELKVPPRRATTAIATVLDALRTLCSEGIGQEEFDLSRRRALHEIEFTIDSAEELAEHYGAAGLDGQLRTLDSAAARLRGLAVADVMRVARRLFVSDRIHATLLGPLERANLQRIRSLVEGFPVVDGSGIRAGRQATSRAVV